MFFVGEKYEREDVLKALETIDITRHFAGISREEIAEAVVDKSKEVGCRTSFFLIYIYII